MLVQRFVNSFPVKYFLVMWDFFFRLAFGPAKTSWALRKPLKSPLDPRNLCFSNLQGMDPLGTCFPSPQSFGGSAGLVLAGSPTSFRCALEASPPLSVSLPLGKGKHLPAKRAAHTETSALLAGYGEQKPSLPPLCTTLKGEATGVSKVKQVSSIMSWNKIGHCMRAIGIRHLQNRHSLFASCLLFETKIHNWYGLPQRKIIHVEKKME